MTYALSSTFFLTFNKFIEQYVEGEYNFFSNEQACHAIFVQKHLCFHPNLSFLSILIIFSHFYRFSWTIILFRITHVIFFTVVYEVTKYNIRMLISVYFNVRKWIIVIYFSSRNGIVELSRTYTVSGVALPLEHGDSTSHAMKYTEREVYPPRYHCHTHKHTHTHIYTYTYIYFLLLYSRLLQY